MYLGEIKRQKWEPRKAEEENYTVCVDSLCSGETYLNQPDLDFFIWICLQLFSQKYIPEVFHQEPCITS